MVWFRPPFVALGGRQLGASAGHSLQNGVTNRHIGQRDTRHETVDKNRSYSVLTCLLLRAASSVHGPWFRWLYARRLDNRAVEDLISTEGPKQFLV
jgi:hypothetical protein